MPDRPDDSEVIAAAALTGALVACLLYATELVARPYAQALASGEAIPYFARLVRGLAGGSVAAGLWLLLARRATVWLLDHVGLVLGATVGLCAAAAVFWR